MARAGTEQGRIDIEVAAGDDDACKPIEKGGGVLRQRWQQHRQAARLAYRFGIVLAQRQPGKAGTAAGRLRV